MESPITRRMFTAMLALYAVLLLCWAWNVSIVPAVTYDDAFVFMQYARNLVDHGILSWSSEEFSADGFTSFSYQMLVALAYAIERTDPVAAAWYASQSVGLALLLALFVTPVIFRGRQASRWVVLIAFASTLGTWALSPLAAYWVQTLMDVGLYALTATLGMFAIGYLLGTSQPTTRRSVLAAAALVLLALTRPEGLVVVSGFTLVIFAKAYLQRQRPLACAGALITICLLTFVAIRLAVYGYILPNPTYLKAPSSSLTQLSKGLRYLVKGVWTGFVPFFLTRFDSQYPAIYVGEEKIWPALFGFSNRWHHQIVLITAPILLLLAYLRPKIWRSSEDRFFIFAAALVPLGLLAVLTAAGGERFYLGWRLAFPSMIAVSALATAAIGRMHVARETSPYLALIAAPLMIACFIGVAQLPFRPEACRAVIPECGLAAVDRMPTTRRNYIWDNSNALTDRMLASAIKASFPKGFSVGHSDFLRGALLFDHPYLDLSGLIDVKIAHSAKSAKFNGATTDVIIERQPDIYIPLGRIVTTLRTADLDMKDHKSFLNAYGIWPINGSKESREQFEREYVPASVELNKAVFFNFFVHRKMAAQRFPYSPVYIGQ